MKEIEFTQDYATKKKGDKWKCDSMLASTLVRDEKVAKYISDKKEVKTKVKAKAK